MCKVSQFWNGHLNIVFYFLHITLFHHDVLVCFVYSSLSIVNHYGLRYSLHFDLVFYYPAISGPLFRYFHKLIFKNTQFGWLLSLEWDLNARPLKTWMLFVSKRGKKNNSLFGTTLRAVVWTVCNTLEKWTCNWKMLVSDCNAS